MGHTVALTTFKSQQDAPEKDILPQKYQS